MAGMLSEGFMAAVVVKPFMIRVIDWDMLIKKGSLQRKQSNFVEYIFFFQNCNK